MIPSIVPHKGLKPEKLPYHALKERGLRQAKALFVRFDESNITNHGMDGGKKGLFACQFERNSGAKAHTKRFSGIAITYRDTDVPRTIAIDEWLAVIGTIGKEAPAFLYH